MVFRKSQFSYQIRSYHNSTLTEFAWAESALTESAHKKTLIGRTQGAPGVTVVSLKRISRQYFWVEEYPFARRFSRL